VNMKCEDLVLACIFERRRRLQSGEAKIGAKPGWGRNTTRNVEVADIVHLESLTIVIHGFKSLRLHSGAR
jgi:hypothetical protein